MDQATTLLIAMVLACAGGLLIVSYLARGRRRQRPTESPITPSSEGVKLCPHCATENLWSEARCVNCGRSLPDAVRGNW